MRKMLRRLNGKKLRRMGGITLIALVVTIIVLLILAGVTITMLIGQNGILNQAINAKNKTEVTTVQELARLTYSEIYANDLTKTPVEVMDNVVNKLNEEGYTAVLDTSGGDVTVTGLTLSDESISLVPTSEDGDKTKDIIVSLATEGDTSSLNYLVTINGEQHKMTYSNGNIEISEEPVQTNIVESYKLTIIPKEIVTNGSVILTVNGENITAEKEIDITSTVTLTVNSTATQINTISDAVNIILKSNSNPQIGEVKNIQVAVEKIYDFTLTSGNYAQVGITREGDVVIPETFIYRGTKYRIVSIAGDAFKSCTNLTSIVIPDSVTSIGNYAFHYCTNLTSATIGNGVTNIGEYAFNNCIGLTSITIPNSVTSIDNSAFNQCNNITTANYTGTLEQWCNIQFGYASANPNYYANNLIINGEKIEGNLIIPSGTTNIGDYAFYGCTNLTSVNIPSGVTSIGNSAFHNCTNLTLINIPDGVTSIGSNVFYECRSLAGDLVIPNSVTSIGTHAFGRAGQETLRITLPNSITEIKSYTFQSCKAVVTIPISVTTIGENAFRDNWYGKIIYEGSEEQWNAISKGTDWNKFGPSDSRITFNTI